MISFLLIGCQVC